MFSSENASLCILAGFCGIEYIMRKIMRFVCVCLCICALIGGALAAFVSGGDEGEAEEGTAVLTLWQIDGFEGGKGSRADYLRRMAADFSRTENVYIEVASLTSAAARQNMANGALPDILSYGAGFYGIERYVTSAPGVWCNGAYCLISLKTSDFSLVSVENTVINGGKDNLVDVAALFAGLSGADVAAGTSAYVMLIDGEYDYLLGTQRDIQRLKTRGENFYVQPLEQFNDLYQYAAVLSNDARSARLSGRFIDYVISRSEELTAIAMLKEGMRFYDDEMSALEGVQYGYGLPAVISERAIDDIRAAAAAGNINLLKSLLKPL